MPGLIKDLIPALRGGSVNCVLTQPAPQAVQEGTTEAQFWSKLCEDPSTQKIPCFAAGTYLKHLQRTTKKLAHDFHELLVWILKSLSELFHPISLVSILSTTTDSHATHLVPVWLLRLHIHFCKNPALSALASSSFPKKGASLLHVCCPVCWERYSILLTANNIL